MYYLFEESNSLGSPVECFIFDAQRESFPVRPHWHYFVEIIYMLEGSAEVHCGNYGGVMTEGELMLFPRKEIHSISAVDSFPLRYAVVKFDINKLSLTSDYAPRLSSIFAGAAGQGMPLRFDSDASEQLNCGRFFTECRQELEEQRYGYDVAVRTMLYGFLIGIVRRWLSCGLKLDERVYGGESACDMDNVTRFIDDNMKEQLSVADIAARCGLSYSCFAKKFSELYGMSCKEYIERLRIVKVEDFLLFTDFDLSYISAETGFSDCSHMIKSFKRYRGTTPHRFREKRQVAQADAK